MKNRLNEQTLWYVRSVHNSRNVWSLWELQYMWEVWSLSNYTEHEKHNTKRHVNMRAWEQDMWNKGEKSMWTWEHKDRFWEKEEKSHSLQRTCIRDIWKKHWRANIEARLWFPPWNLVMSTYRLQLCQVFSINELYSSYHTYKINIFKWNLLKQPIHWSIGLFQCA